MACKWTGKPILQVVGASRFNQGNLIQNNTALRVGGLSDVARDLMPNTPVGRVTITDAH